MLVTDHDSGGYDMDDSEIGVVLMAAAVLQLMFQVHINTLYNIYMYFADLAHFEGFKDLFPTQELMIVPTQLIHFIPPPHSPVTCLPSDCQAHWLPSHSHLRSSSIWSDEHTVPILQSDHGTHWGQR